MTLEQRVAWIKSEKGIDVFRTTLAKWYRRQGVVYTKPTFKISSRYTD